MTKEKQSGIDPGSLPDMFGHEINSRLVHRGKDPNSVDQSVRLVIANEIYWETHGEELNAVLTAEEGNPTTLQELIRAKGALQTEYGRDCSCSGWVVT